MTRAVLDPNVLVSAAIRPYGVAAQCVTAHAEGRFELIVSPKLLAELRLVLRRAKFRHYLSAERAERYVDALERAATMVADPPAYEAVSRDPSDDYLIALARVASAHAVVSGDADLLDLTLVDVRVVSPRAFLDVLPA